jgi:hypothetical protein
MSDASRGTRGPIGPLILAVKQSFARRKIGRGEAMPPVARMRVLPRRELERLRRCPLFRT